MTKEQEALSALMDGELSPRRAAALVDRLCRDPDLAQAWVRMHRVRQFMDGASSSVDVRAAVAMNLAQVDDKARVVGLPGRLVGRLARLVAGCAPLLRPAPALALAGLAVVSVVALWPGEAPQPAAPTIAQNTRENFDAPTDRQFAATGGGDQGRQEFLQATTGEPQSDPAVTGPGNRPYQIPPGKYEEYLARHEMAASAGAIPRAMGPARLAGFAQ